MEGWKKAMVVWRRLLNLESRSSVGLVGMDTTWLVEGQRWLCELFQPPSDFVNTSKLLDLKHKGKFMAIILIVSNLSQ